MGGHREVPSSMEQELRHRHSRVLGLTEKRELESAEHGPRKLYNEQPAKG